jgi:hypothetical protein
MGSIAFLDLSFLQANPRNLFSFVKYFRFISHFLNVFLKKKMHVEVGEKQCIWRFGKSGLGEWWVEDWRLRVL